MKTGKKKYKKFKKSVPSKTMQPMHMDNLNKKWAYIIIIILTFILYANTITHDYVLDDAMVITKNRFTQEGFNGIKGILSYDSLIGYLGHQTKYLVGGRYRPLSIVTFAIEHEFFGSNPHVSHFVNILLYALTCIIIYKILSHLLFKYKGIKWYLSISFVTTIFFIAHPIHTEVVANIKSRDEIMALLGSLFTLWFLLRYLNDNKARYQIYSTITFFLACMSKENAILFIVIIPLTIYFFKNLPLKKIITVLIPISVSAFLFLIIRQSVLINPSAIKEELLNNPFLYSSITEKYATIFYTLGLYLKLLFYPHPLTYDYYPYHIPIISWSDIRALIPFIVYIGLGIYGLLGLKRKSIISYGIWFYLITLSIGSNVLFPIGTFMAERFIFISSLGFCLILSYLFINKIPIVLKTNKIVLMLLISVFMTILAFYSIITISRNMIWKNNYTLTTTDIKVSSNSAKANSAAADFLIVKAKNTRDQIQKEKDINLALKYLHKAIKIHPKYERALAILADTYNHHKQNYERAIFFYEQIYKLNPRRKNVAYNLGTMYLQVEGLDVNKAIDYLKTAIELNPRQFGAIKNLGVAYYRKSDYIKAIQMYERAIKLNSNDAHLFNNTGIAYQQLGENEKAQYYFDRYRKLQQ
jgi:tetratricopeptide (TPR) repeat protein